MTPRRLFALDQNFPEPVLAALESVLPAELVPVRKIDPKLSEVADWELLLALHRHSRPWDGLITNDDAMLKLPKELVVLSQTRLTLVVAKGEGHNPIRAVGALLCHLSHIRHQTNPQVAQIWCTGPPNFGTSLPLSPPSMAPRSRHPPMPSMRT